MKYKELKEVLTQASTYFELHQQHADDKGNVIREKWVSFSSKMLKTEDQMYQTLSHIVHDADCDEDTAYAWTLNAIEVLSDAVDEADRAETELTDDEIELMRDYISERADAMTPIYNAELVEWLAKGHENVELVDQSIKEMGKAESLYDDIRGAYCMGFERHIMEVLDHMLEVSTSHEE